MKRKNLYWLVFGILFIIELSLLPVIMTKLVGLEITFIVAFIIVDVLYAILFIFYEKASKFENQGKVNVMEKLRRLEFVSTGIILGVEAILLFILLAVDTQEAFAMLVVYIFINLFYLLIVIIINTTRRKKYDDCENPTNIENKS